MSSDPEFKHDVFLSHSAEDKDIVREIANRLKSDGVRVWFDEWLIKPGDSIPAKIEDGLEHSRVLVLCMSAAALASNWPQLESHTFRFKDPLNLNRRFIPLRLDDAPIKGSLAQFSYIDWRPEQRKFEYTKLLEACKTNLVAAEEKSENQIPTSSGRGRQLSSSSDIIRKYAFNSDWSRVLAAFSDRIAVLFELPFGRHLLSLMGPVNDIAWTEDDTFALLCSGDGAIQVWDLDIGRCIRRLEGHDGDVTCVAFDNPFVLSAGGRTVRRWNWESGESEVLFSGQLTGISSLDVSGDFVLSGGHAENVAVLWSLKSGKCLHVFRGHTGIVLSVKILQERSLAITGSGDQTVRIWSLEDGTCERILEGHTGRVRSVTFAGTRFVLSGAEDTKMLLWEVDSGRCIRVFKGHSHKIVTVSYNPLSSYAYSGDAGGCIWEWDLSELVTVAQSPNGRASALSPDQVQYTNAKVLLVGNSSAGKTGLSNRLALGTYKETDSTVGAWATQWKLPLETKDDVEREVWLWDFGGQADQRLIHQLYMDQTQVAALVFDPQKQELLDTLGTWDRDLTRAATGDFKKLLVAGRTDAGGLRSVSHAQVETFAKERGFAGYIETSAKENVGCEELKTAIIDLIDWDQMTKRTSPALFKRLKEEIVRLKEEGRVLMRLNELREALALRMSNEHEDSRHSLRESSTETRNFRGAKGHNRFTDDELKTVIALLAGPGVVWELGFGSWILLQPELINSYAQSVIRSLRDDERELGCIAETQVLSGDLAFPKENPRLDQGDERIVLLAMHQILVEHGLCLRDEDPEQKSPTMLVFPSYARRERPDLIEYPSVIVSYQFNGFLDDIYATLVVRLHHTHAFDRDQLWLDAADFKTMTGRRLGVKLSRRADGAGELEVYFDPDISVEEMMVFSKYVHEHLLQKAKDVVRLRHYVCTHEYKGKPCETEANRQVAMERLAERGQHATINCQRCDETMELWDELERRFADPNIQKSVRELEEQSKFTLDTENKERILVGEVISTVALAGQICRELTVSDHGIDMEIEFKNDQGKPTGKKLYLQLKSGDSWLRRLKSGKETFDIKKNKHDEVSRHAEYWATQAFPVMLIIMNSSWEFKKNQWQQSEGRKIRWMEIRDYLKANRGTKSIEFVAERFDVMSVRRWRDKALGSGQNHDESENSN